MILTFGSLANSTPYLGGILLVIVLAWLAAAKSLDSQFSPLAKEELHREKVSKAAAKEPQLVTSPPEASSPEPVEKKAPEETGNGSATSNGTALKVDAAVDDPSETSAPQA